MVKPDYLVPLGKIGPLLGELAQEPARNGRRHQIPEHLKIETAVDEMKTPMNNMASLGKPSSIACPECHGVLWEMKEKGLVHYRCRVGHAFSLESLRAEMSTALEAALWSAVRALEEKASLLQRLADEARKRKHKLTAREFEKRFQEFAPAAKTIRGILLKVHD
jgi:two-component system chemotaxis response regulator CheB